MERLHARRSLGSSRVLAVVLAGLAVFLFSATAVGYLAALSWWPTAMLAASAVSLLVMILYLSPWWSVGIAISLGLAVFAAGQHRLV